MNTIQTALSVCTDGRFLFWGLGGIMPKNIIICCDGTGNEYKYPFTNVLKLYTMEIGDT